MNTLLADDGVLIEVVAIDPNISGLAAGAEAAVKDAAVKDEAVGADVIDGVDEGNAAPKAALVTLVAPNRLLPIGCAVEAVAADADVEGDVKVALVGGVGLLVGGTSSSSSDKNELFG